MERIRRMPVRLILREVTHHGVLGRAREWFDEVCVFRWLADVDLAVGDGGPSFYAIRIQQYVGINCLLAVARGRCALRVSAGMSFAHVGAALWLSGLGILAQMMLFSLPQGAGGTIAFIPFLALGSRRSPLDERRIGGPRVRHRRGTQPAPLAQGASSTLRKCPWRPPLVHCAIWHSVVNRFCERP